MARQATSCQVLLSHYSDLPYRLRGKYADVILSLTWFLDTTLLEVLGIVTPNFLKEEATPAFSFLSFPSDPWIKEQLHLIDLQAL